MKISRVVSPEVSSNSNISEALHPAGYPLTSSPTEGGTGRNTQAEGEIKNNGGAIAKEADLSKAAFDENVMSNVAFIFA